MDHPNNARPPRDARSGQHGGPQERPTLVERRPARPMAAPALAQPRLDAAAETDPGRERPRNEDAVLLELPDQSVEAATRGALGLVADGMGGHAAGDVASRLALETVRAQYYASRGQEPLEALHQAVLAANSEILLRAAERPEWQGMGCTLTAAVLRGDELLLAHVGDTRAYLIRAGGLAQLTDDHSWVAEQVRAGLLTEEQARAHPRRNVITRALGSRADVQVDLHHEQLQPDDVLVLCSDGLHGVLSDLEIGGLAAGLPAADAARALIREANARGAPDNVSVAVVRLGPPPRRPLGTVGLAMVSSLVTLVLLAVVLVVAVLPRDLSSAQLAAPTAQPTTPTPLPPTPLPTTPRLLALPAPSPASSSVPALIEGPDGEANLRAAPRLDAPSRAVLPNSTRVAIMAEAEGDAVRGSPRWLQVEVISGERTGEWGYVHSSLVLPITAPGSPARRP